MDGARFDGLARSLAASCSRRGVLGALAGAACGALGLGVAAEARTRRAIGSSISDALVNGAGSCMSFVGYICPAGGSGP